MKRLATYLAVSTAITFWTLIASAYDHDRIEPPKAKTVYRLSVEETVEAAKLWLKSKNLPSDGKVIVGGGSLNYTLTSTNTFSSTSSDRLTITVEDK